ncbi:MAG: dihydroorotase [Elusimicrobia bacterium]|nr:dihydroorotase [Elusimicrobiota bacterium]
MTPALLIRNGLVIDPAQKIEAVKDVLVEDGKIAAVQYGLSKKNALRGIPSLNAKGRWVVPGLIDMHVHLREPGGEEAETIATGAAAAARGGFATVLAMPNTRPVVDAPDLLQDLRARARDAAVNVLFAAAVTAGQQGRRLSRLEALQRAGAAAFSDDGRPVADAGLMREALRLSHELGALVIDHCEDPGLMGTACETVMAARDMALAEETGGRLHVAHASAAGTVEALRQAKARTASVTGEAAPHHWTLCESDIPGRAVGRQRLPRGRPGRSGSALDRDANFKMNPPLRSPDDRDALRRGLADGAIDAIASDHAPHSRRMKALGFDRAPFGVIGLETSLGLALTELLGSVLSRLALVERMSSAPARILGLRSKGGLAVGMDADVTVIDPDAAWTVRPPFASKSSNSPFVGMRLRGRAAATVVGGRIVHAL